MSSARSFYIIRMQTSRDYSFRQVLSSFGRKLKQVNTMANLLIFLVLSGKDPDALPPPVIAYKKQITNP